MAPHEYSLSRIFIPFMQINMHKITISGIFIHPPPRSPLTLYNQGLLVKTRRGQKPDLGPIGDLF